jgi:hypothetical protein
MASDSYPREKEYFGDLPEALVEQLIAESDRLGQVVIDSLKKINDLRSQVRTRLEHERLLRRVEDLPRVEEPTTCGVDGAYAVESLLGYDIVVAVGLATEGLTPPSEQRHWEEPHFCSFINIEPHRQENRSYARALMVTFELEQAAKAPHDVVFLDGSFTTPITALHQALSQKELENQKEESNLPHRLTEQASQAVLNYHSLLTAERADRIWVSVPKYTTKREIAERLQIDQQLDDRALCTLILNPGEFIGPVPLGRPTKDSSGWEGYFLTPKFLSPDAVDAKKKVERMLMEGIRVLYFKPSPSNPALRIEIPQAVAGNEHRLATALAALRSQSAIPGILEPQPLYYADRMAKSLSVAIPALREILSRSSVRDYSDNISDVFFVLHSYRTEE